MIRKPHVATGAAVAAVLLAVVCPVPAVAGTQDGAVVALHAAVHSKSSVCSTQDPVSIGLPCRDFTTTWPVNTTCDLYLVVARAELLAGILGVSFGIRYNNGETGEATQYDGQGVDVFGFTMCASGLQFCNGPCPPCCPEEYQPSGSGDRIIWMGNTDCQTTVIGSDGVHALAGVFYLFAYSDDLFEITPNYQLLSTPAEFAVGDCNGTITDLPYPEAAAAVAFGAGIGRNPCAPTPVQPTTWSRLKNRYDR